jgi:hypothetical protein
MGIAAGLEAQIREIIRAFYKIPANSPLPPSKIGDYKGWACFNHINFDLGSGFRFQSSG